jgi:hypothetical protein
VASDFVVPRIAERSSHDDDVVDVRDTTIDLRDEAEPAATDADTGCVICGADAPEAGACCSSRCAGEAQRQLRRNAARLRRLERRDAHELRHHLSERNGRLMSAILRWRPEAHEPSLS